WNTTLAANGSHTLSAVARDAAGNTATSSAVNVTVFNDTTPPTIAITAPTTASTYSTSSSPLTLGGTASDNVGVTQVTWANSRGGSRSATRTRSWTASRTAIDLHTLVPVASEQAGTANTSTAIVTVTGVDAIAPTIAITAPTG